MKFVHGIAIPDDDAHFTKMITAPFHNGKGTYQLKKLLAALEYIPAYRRRTALDIGGHVGLWSRVLASHFRTVIAFEPLPIHIECFRENVTKDESLFNVDLVEFALSDKAEKLAMVVPEDNTGHSHVAAFAGPIEAITLDGMNIRSIDFIKVDVEGYELPIIRGAEETIRREKPVMIVEQKPHGNAERYGWGQHDAIRLLEKWGMRQSQVISGDHIMVW